ncbi:hypothetical protein CFP65_3479 [Kitasatospora sp. MMS16-BH015]|uniref:tyrosine-protein phosphatase n=1 Tax=Kitasatospora sp. MMS16-BH015 TaxID=2018025 RepID=UPI000CA20F32|nr:tyrosine-protein phosphatase [Kitasatospora sp. MMS16-BH015]AUG78272.1 hypothetical protein CFP65_3479 [Kitasatospora sp. MMS16-BH015]
MTATTTPGVNFRPVRATGLRPGRLLRSADVTAFTERDAAELRDRYGIRTVIDLRTPRESDRYGVPQALIDAGIRWVQAPVTGYASTPIDKPRPTSQDVVRYYHGMLAEADPACWRELFHQLAEAAAEPFLVCCHCGKDRTGVVVAALLELAGCPAGEIALDYGASAVDLVAQVDRFADKWTRRGHTREDYLTRMRTAPETLADWLGEVREQRGGLVPFLRERGVAEADLARLRRELTDGGEQR